MSLLPTDVTAKSLLRTSITLVTCLDLLVTKERLLSQDLLLGLVGLRLHASEVKLTNKEYECNETPATRRCSDT